MTQDLTQKKPLSLIFKFTMPLLLGNLIQQLYFLIDSIIVSVFVGPQALAGVGIASAIDFIMFGFAHGAVSGFCVIVGQKFGAKRKMGIKFSVASAIYLYVVFTIVLTIVGIISTKPLLILMDTPDGIFQHAYDYLFIIFLSSFAQIGYMLFCGMLKSIGDNKSPLIFLILSVILNLILDYIAVYLLNMQTKGAAIATLIAETISFVLCVIFMHKKYKFMWPHKKEWEFKKHYILAEIKIGLPMAFEFFITGLGIIILQKAVNHFNSSTIAGFTIAMRIEDLVITSFYAVATAAATFTAQNFGAQKYHRIKKGAQSCFLIGLLFCFIFGGAIMILWDQIVSLYLNTEFSKDANSIYNIKKAAREYITIAIFNFPILSSLMTFRSVVQSIGKTLIPLLASFCELFMRVIGALLFAKWFGYIGICWSPISAWYSAFLMIIISYFYHMHKLKRYKV